MEEKSRWEEEDYDSYDARNYTQGNACGTFAF